MSSSIDFSKGFVLVPYDSVKPQPKNTAPSTLTFCDKIKRIFGLALAIFGFILIIATVGALIGHLVGKTVVQPESAHALFMTGLMSTIGGLHLAKGRSASPDYASVDVGPFTWYV